MLSIPDSVRENAELGNDMKDDGYDGGREKGEHRGYQLETEEYISLEDAIEMRAWFARHVITSYGNYEEWTQASTEEKKGTDLLGRVL